MIDVTNLVHPSSREALNQDEWVVPHNTLVPVSNVLSLLRKTKRARFFLKVSLPHYTDKGVYFSNDSSSVKVRWADVVEMVEESIESEACKRENPEKQVCPLKDDECYMYSIAISRWENGCVFLG